MNLFVRERESQGNSGLIWSMKRKKAWSNPNVLMKATKVPNIHYELYLVYLTICNILYNLKKKKNQNKLHLLLRACNHDYYRSLGGSECVILSLLISKFVLAVLFYFCTRLTTGAGACWLFPELGLVALLWESVFM